MDESATASARASKVLPAVGRVAARNTDSFGSVGAADVLVRVLTQYDFDVNVVQWAARAVNNLSRSRSLKSEFLKAGAVEVLSDLHSKYEGSKDSQLWIKQAVESLQSATTVAHAGADRTPHASATATGMGMGMAAMSFTTEKISTKIGDLLNMNSSVSTSGTSGGGGGVAGVPVDKSAAKKRQSPGPGVNV